jgi:hypothetical protein
MLEQPFTRESSPEMSIRGLMWLVAAGFIVVIVALLILGWPSGQWGDKDLKILPQIMRTVFALRGEVTLPAARLALDVGIYVLVMIGLAFLVAAWRGGSRGAVTGLLVISILGLSYVSGMALYIGPMVSTCGFLLILFGGLVAWASMPRQNLPEQPIDDRGTDEYASHPVT